MAKRIIKAYGNLTNRIEEGNNYNKDKQIHVGDDITMYHWSDRTCYYVTDVINQKHIKVKRYHVCADRSKGGGQGHQNWLLFKTKKEEHEYLKQFFPERSEYDDVIKEAPEEEWVFRYGKWKQAHKYSPEDLDAENMFGVKLRDVYFTESDIKKLEAGKDVYKYTDLSGAISFGIRDYYYDWSF